MHRIAEEAINADAERNEGCKDGHWLERKDKDRIAVVTIHEVAVCRESHKDSYDQADCRSENARVMMLVFCFSSNIDNDGVSFEDEHCYANISEHLCDVEKFERSVHDFVIFDLG